SLSLRVRGQRDDDERSRRPRADRSMGAPATHRDAVVGVTGAFSHVGSTNPPLPAESHTANRTHDLPLASNGMAKCFVPNGPRSVAEMIWRSIFLPSPQTTSTNDNGNVHSTSAAMVRWLPVPSIL